MFYVRFFSEQTRLTRSKIIFYLVVLCDCSAVFSNCSVVLIIRGGVEDTRPKAKDTKKIRGQGQEQPFRGQTLSRPRTGMLEAKAKDKGYKAQVLSKKKKVLHKNFSGDLQKKKGLHKNFSGDL